MSIVLDTAPTFRAYFDRFAKAVGYVVHEGATILDTAEPPLKAFARGLREDDLFMEALQRDIVAVVDVEKFTAIVGEATPRRLDRLVIAGTRYTVEAWRGAPITEPVFFKLLLRGGQQ
jgi:hypothetical protein